MENKEFAIVLEKRTRAFAVRIIRLSIKLPKSEEGRVMNYPGAKPRGIK